MRTDQRRHEIVRQLYLTGYAEARELAETLGVDSSTIRRDLDHLARAGHVQRTHGGARLVAGAVDLPYEMKEREHLDAKAAIGRAGALLVADGERVLLDSGSTTYELARELRGRQDLAIVTNDLRIAQLVTGFPGVQLLVTGGELLRSTYTLFGDRSVEFVRELSVDHAFLGADAIDVSGITNTNTLEVPLKRAMIDVAGAAIVLADSSKFGERALVRVAEIAEVDLIITDDGLPPDVAAPFGDAVRRVPVAEAPVGGPAHNGRGPKEDG